MSLKDIIAGHAQPERMRCIDVPEWGAEGEPLRIHYRMVTLDDMAMVNELEGSAWHRQAARIVVMKAIDANEQRLFKHTDAAWLRESAAPDVVNRIATAMLGRLSVDDARKN